jgi:hypothetical protein
LAIAATLVVTSLVSAVCSAEQAEHEARLARAINNPAFHVDERGRAFRVAFPPHDRLLIEYGAMGSSSRDFEQRARVAWKTTLGLDFAEENIWWRFRHTFADLEFSWGAGGRRLEATAVRADYLRHDMSSFIVIPTEQDIKLPAPFDIAIDYELGSFELVSAGSAGSTLPESADEASAWSVEHIDVAQVAIPLDFIRDPDYRHRLAIGPAGAYRISLDSEPRTHALAPLTGAELLYAWESDDGLYQVDLRARCMSAVTIGGQSEGRWSVGCDGRARAEMIAFSINDQPVSIPAEFEVADSFGARDELEWSASIGLRLSFVETL